MMSATISPNPRRPENLPTSPVGGGGHAVSFIFPDCFGPHHVKPEEQHTALANAIYHRIRTRMAVAVQRGIAVEILSFGRSDASSSPSRASSSASGKCPVVGTPQPQNGPGGPKDQRAGVATRQGVVSRI